MIYKNYKKDKEYKGVELITVHMLIKWYHKWYIKTETYDMIIKKAF